MDKVRLFTALKIPGALRQQIQALPRIGLESARWSHPEDLHITLRFIGDVESERLPDIEDILTRVRVSAMTLVVNGLGIFEKKNQSILYAAVESAKKVTHLSAEITERIQSLGFDYPPQPYKPHVTVARMNRPRGLDDYITKNQQKIRASWDADSFILYRSATPDESGQRYTVIKDYPLGRF